MKKAVSLALAFLLIFSQVPVLTVPVGAEEITEGSGQVIQKVEAILEEETAEATDKVDLASPEQVDLGIETSNEDEGEALDEAGTDVPEKEQSAEIPEAEKTAHKETDNLSNFSVLVDGEALEDFSFDGTVEEQTIKLTKQQLANTAFALKYDACEDAVLKILRNEQADIAGFTEAVRVQRKPITVAAFDDVDEINVERYSFSFLLGHLDETGVFVQTSYYVLHVEPIAEAVQEKDENANSQAEKETAKQDGITDQDDTEQNEQIETSENDPDYITDIQILHNGAPLPADFFSFQKECEKQKAVIVADKLTDNLTVSIGIRMGDNVFFRILRDGQQTVTNFQTDVKIDGDTMTVKPFTNKQKDNYYCGKYSFEFSVGTKYDSNADGVIDASDEFESISSYTLDVEIIPAFYKVNIVNQAGAVLKNVNGPTGLELYDKSYSMTVNSSTISFNMVQTRPGIGTRSTSVSLYVGDNGPITKNVTDSRPVQIDLADYTTEGSNIARIPVRMDNSTLGISRTIIFYVTYNDPSNPVVSDLQGFECDKNTEQKLAVELSCENEGTLTYQWYARSKQLSVVVAEPIAGAIERELTVPTDWAGTMYYSCEVTNTVTVDGVEKQYKSNTNEAAVTVKLSEVSSPEIKEQPGTYALLNQGQDYSVEYKIAYTRGQVLDTVFVRLRYPEFGTSYTAQFACKDSGTGEAKELKGTTILVDRANSNFKKYTSSDAYIDYAFIPSAPLPVGEYDIYCVITAADKENAEKTASTTSDSVHITVTKPETTLSGTGTQTDPFMITCGDDLNWVREQVAGGNPFAGSYFKFKNDVTLPEPWQPIGCTKDGTTNIDSGRNLNPFSGIIDGDNFTLTVPEGSEPLLGYVRDATVQNLNIYGKQINGYGLVNNFEGVGLQGSAIAIDHCTLKSGTQTLKSGFLGANITSNHYAGTSAGFTATIRNCTVEKDVIIGYTGTYDRIGSIAGRFQGTIENCVSYATVQGTGCVGGLVGAQDQAMGQCAVYNSSFHGTVTGSGSYVGGIVGSGYNDFGEASAPNGGRPTIQGCSSDGTVVGASCVGGILGGDQYVAQTWDNVISYVTGNTFTGTVSGSNYVGGIIGYYNSLNRYDHVSDNTFAEGCGTERGIGFVKYLDTSCQNPAAQEGTVVFNTETTVENCPYVQWCSWKTGHNRTDDPLGVNAEKLTRMSGGSERPTCYRLEVTGEDYKKVYTAGEELDLSGIELTAYWTDHTTTKLHSGDITVSGYNKDEIGSQTLTLNYGNMMVDISITVNPKSQRITVSVSILGDSHHSNPMSNGGPHGLARGGLTTWASVSSLEADAKDTVWNVLERVMEANNLSVHQDSNNSYGSVYIRAVNGLGEFDNGQNSGWMYTVNGTHPNVGVSARYVSDGDVIVLHYTDDYNYEEGGSKYGQPVQNAEYVITLINSIGTVSYTDACKAKIDAARKAYDALSSEEQARVTNYATLTAAEKKYDELKLADDKAQAKKVDDLIGKIGTVTANSGPAITAAWNGYNGLTAAQKGYVTKLAVLQEATRKWNQLKADAVIKLIDQIVTPVTAQSKASIDAARSAYNALNKDQQALVTNLKKLTDADAAYAKLTATQEDKDKAQAVIDQIKKLGDITLDSEKDILVARKAYDALTDLQKKLVENYDVLTAAEARLAMLKTLGKVSDPYVTTGDYMEKLGTPCVGAVGGEWMVIGLVRSGRTVPGADTYYQGAVQYIQQAIDPQTGRLHKAKSTDNSRMILALTALGKDVTNVGGHNLLQGLSDLDYVKYQGNNGPIWALLALDSGNYPAPSGGTTTRQALIEEILRVQTSDGGWAISGDKADSDMTGMALTALAPYYKKDLKVQAAIDKAVARLSEMQDADGGFSTSYGDGKMVATSESISQVVTALSALGINADTDPRFIKDGGSAIDALLRYYVSGGGFKHVMDGALDGMGTEQAYYALTAYYRFLTGKTNLYDMTDVINRGGDPVEVPTEPTVPAATEPGEETPAKSGFPWWIIVICVVAAYSLGVVTVTIIIPKFKKKG
ncbi:MAG: DUF4430 domain-containing protein [Candidatus Faecousia sp.]|nr:DUF4430 domain-containing protein [Candidatus Faecousia sp.]